MRDLLRLIADDSAYSGISSCQGRLATMEPIRPRAKRIPTGLVMLRDMKRSDLSIFFRQQVEPDFNCLKNSQTQDRETFISRWTSFILQKSTLIKTIVADGKTAGYYVCWEEGDQLLAGTWLGKKYWSRGIATVALSQLIPLVNDRPLNARIAKRNSAAIKVVIRNGFEVCGKDQFRNGDGELLDQYHFRLEASTSRLRTSRRLLK